MGTARGSIAGTVAIVAAALCMAPAAEPASAATGLRVVLDTPRGVPANVVLSGSGKRFVVTGRARGSRRVVRLRPRPGTYRISAPTVISSGRAYAAAAPRSVRVRKGRVARLTVRYRAVPSASSLRVTAVRPASISLAWKGPRGARYALRRSAGAAPVTTRTGGRGVRVAGTTAVDKGLTAGGLYSYALFTRRKGKWTGPITLRVTAAPKPGGANEVSYVLNPSTLVLAASDIARVTRPAAGGVTVSLKSGAAIPVLGAGVVLGDSAVLPGGYIGTVSAISGDGLTLTLAPAALADAFDAYRISVPDIGAAPALRDVPAGLRAASAAQASAPRSVALGLGLAECGGARGRSAGEWRVSRSFDGHYLTSYSRATIAGLDIPVGATFDVAFTKTVTSTFSGSFDVGPINCGWNFTPDAWVLARVLVGPVPVSIVLAVQPVATAEITGGGTVSGLAFSTTSGFWFKGSVNGPTTTPFTGGKFATGTASPPLSTRRVALNIRLGGQLTIGPGMVDLAGGAVMGIQGEFIPFDFSVARVSHPDQQGDVPACWTFDQRMTASLALAARAWLGRFGGSVTVAPEWARGTIRVLGYPRDTPAGCSELRIVTDALAPAMQDQPYGPRALEAAGGTAPYRWKVASGKLPDGLELDEKAGVIFGTPKRSGLNEFTLEVTDASDEPLFGGSPPRSATRSFTLSVVPAVSIEPSGLPDGEVGAAYLAPQLVARANEPSALCTWQTTSGQLPGGLKLDGATGRITGTPTTPGTSHFEVGAACHSDTFSGIGKATYQITIHPALKLTTAALPGAKLNTAYEARLQASDGKPPYSWAITAGDLPDGLHLDPATGVIAGAPTAVGEATFEVAVTDQLGVERRAEYTIPVRTPGTTLVVTNESENTVTLISQTSHAVLATLPVGSRAMGVAVSPDDRYAYVTSLHFGLSVVDLQSRGVVASIPLAAGAGSAAVTPDGASVYVASPGGWAYIVDTATNAVVKTFGVGGAPQDVAISPDGSTAYISLGSGNGIALVDIPSQTLSGTIPLGQFTSHLAPSPDGSRLYATLRVFASTGGGTVAAIDTATRQVVATAFVGGAAYGIGITPDGRVLYVGRVFAEPVVLRADPLAVVATIDSMAEVAGAGYGAAVSADGRRAYISSFEGVLAVDTGTNQVIAKLAQPSVYGIATSP